MSAHKKRINKPCTYARRTNISTNVGSNQEFIDHGSLQSSLQANKW